MRVLCICQHGNVRSVACAYILKTLYGYDALACGVADAGKDTLEMLALWADLIIIMDKTLKLPLKFCIKFNKKIKVLDVGPDVWFNPRHQELQHKILKKIRSIV